MYFLKNNKLLFTNLFTSYFSRLPETRVPTQEKKEKELTLNIKQQEKHKLLLVQKKEIDKDLHNLKNFEKGKKSNIGNIVDFRLNIKEIDPLIIGLEEKYTGLINTTNVDEYLKDIENIQNEIVFKIDVMKQKFDLREESQQQVEKFLEGQSPENKYIFKAVAEEVSNSSEVESNGLDLKDFIVMLFQLFIGAFGKENVEEGQKTKKIESTGEVEVPRQREKKAKGKKGNQTVSKFLSNKFPGGEKIQNADSLPNGDRLRGKKLLENPEFSKKLDKVAISIGANKDDLIKVMIAESSLDPRAVNSSSKATGLIQFMPRTAKGLGTSVYQIRMMTAVEQLDLVEEYFRQNGKGVALNSVVKLYQVVFYPLALRKGPDFVYGSEQSLQYARKVAKQNSGIAKYSTRSDGLIDQKAFMKYAENRGNKYLV